MNKVFWSQISKTCTCYLVDRNEKLNFFIKYWLDYKKVEQQDL